MLMLGGVIFSTISVVRAEYLAPQKESAVSSSRISLDHFNHLFAPITVGGTNMAVVNIYSEYPDYAFAIEPAEGFACVDDVARAIVMLADYVESQPSDEMLHKIKLMVEFILYMQNDNGYFNNFIWGDLSINTQYKTSVAELNWWSFRALWSLERALDLFSSDAELTGRIEAAIEKTVTRIKADLPLKPVKTEVVNSVELPTHLPNKYAADQAALAIIALLPYHERRADDQILNLIKGLAQGIMQMQKGDADNYPYGMFLSWQNEWHAWGNSQAYALLRAGQQLGQPDFIASALLEVDHFYPYLMEKGLPASIAIRREGEDYSPVLEKKFPQIAYGLRPMVYAVSEAYQITKNEKYVGQLTKLRAWFHGTNVTGRYMYNQDNGRTYDGIISAGKINMNSGAESTIEALMVMQK